MTPLESMQRACVSIEADIQRVLERISILNDERVELNDDVAKLREVLRQYRAAIERLS